MYHPHAYGSRQFKYLSIFSIFNQIGCQFAMEFYDILYKQSQVLPLQLYQV